MRSQEMQRGLEQRPAHPPFHMRARFLILPPPPDHVMWLMCCPILQASLQNKESSNKQTSAEVTSEGRLVTLRKPAYCGESSPLPNYILVFNPREKLSDGTDAVLGLWIIITMLPFLPLMAGFNRPGSGEVWKQQTTLPSVFLLRWI